ncbi:MAG: SDR family NAD(P)-dependent oxidoreductase [Desulfobacteraceae bacterium]
MANSGERPTYLAGHSLGEYNALFAAGVFDFETGLRLVKRRAELMAQAEGGGMMAVLGADHQTIEKTLAEHRLAGIDIAGLNAPSQTVISGPHDELALFERHFHSSKTVSCMPLRVSAAFHSRYMADARKQFAGFLETIHFSKIRIPVIANATAAPYQNDRIRQLLCDQITHCVRWEETIRYLGKQDNVRFEEIGPSRVLTGLVEQIQQATAPDRKITSMQSTVSMFAHRSDPKRGGSQAQQTVKDTGSKREIAANVSRTKRGRSQKARQSMLKADGDAADIAIIGMACRFPGADNYHQYWYNLEHGINSIREITPDRWDINQYYSPDINEPNKSISKWCGLIDDIDKFDNTFFNISPREAKNMDPQQRLLLEETWRCIEDSGVPIEKLRRKRTAVYIGVMASDYRQEASRPGVFTDSYAASGNYDAMLANRISYAFGFSGASVSVDTACASSLVAIDGAKRSLLIGESDYAVAGGVSLNLHPWKYLSFSKARMLSPDGQCKTFDADANGYVPGEGIGVLLLQRLEDAQRAGNPIYGIIKGCAVNHGGRTQSLTAPRVEAQRDVILQAYQEANISPETVSYVEAHGTGTSLGDPIEIEALTRAFRRFTDNNDFCKIGSVKSNIGHLEAAAGVAGVIKVLMMMQHQKIPQSLNIKEINPIIQFDNSPFSIAMKLSDWDPETDDTIPLRAGVSSFGMGGVNAHILLEQAPPADCAQDTEHGQLFVLSAKNRNSLNRMLTDWKSFVAGEQFSCLGFKDICRTMLTGRDSFPYRFGVYAEDKDSLKELIALAAQSAVAVQPSQKFYCLRIGSLKIDGYSRIEPLLHDETVFSECLKEIRIDLHKLAETCQSFEDLNRLQKLASGFEENNWAPAAQSVYAFMVDYAYAAALIKIGAAPGLITGGKEGALAGLASCGIIRPIDALALLTQQMKPQEISLRRPKLPFLDPVSGKIIDPFRFTREYIRFIRDELRTDPDLLEHYLEKGQLLFKGQFTFKRYMQEWNTVLKDWGISVEEMLFNKAGDAPLYSERKRDKLLILVIIISSLHKLRLKWDLTQQKPIMDQLLSEVVDLIVDNVMGKEILVRLFLDGQPDFNEITAALCKNYHRMDLSKPYHYIRTQNRGLKEIDDVSDWLTRLPSSITPLPQIENMVCVDLGESDSASKAMETVTLQMGGDLDRSIKEFLLQLWLHGVHIEWSKIFSDGQFKKVQLPGYAFDRKSFWLNCKDQEPKSLMSATMGEAAATLSEIGDKKKYISNPQPNQESGNSCGAVVDVVNSGPFGGEIASETDSCHTTFLQKVWKESPAIPDRRFQVGIDENPAGNILLFDTDENLRNALRSGNNCFDPDTQIVLVLPGDSYLRRDNSTYVIRPHIQKDYRQLIETLKKEGMVPNRIIHMWSYDGAMHDESALDRQLQFTIYALFYQIRELILQHVEGKIKLLHVYRSLNGEVQPQSASIAGFAKSLQIENPRFSIGSVEIAGSRETTVGPTFLAKTLLQELQIVDQNYAAIRYIGSRRWVERYKEIDLVNYTSGNLKIRDGGVYLITGGFGGLGQIFARYLVTQFNAQIVLSGRSELTPDRKKVLEELEAYGTKVLYVNADVSRRDEVDRLIGKIKSRFKNLNGIFHAAGEVRDAYFINKPIEEIKAVLGPKVHGTLNLDRATQSEPIDFLVLFSSIVAVHGNAGQCDYAYGNAFMDAFAQWREDLCKKNKRYGKTISINWPLWEEGGMNLPEWGRKQHLDTTGWVPLSTADGLKIWEMVANSGYPHIAVDHRISSRTVKTREQIIIDKEQPKPDNDMSALYAQTEQYLTQVLAGLLELSIEDLNSQVPFKEYGVDSIMIHHFNAAMEQDFESLSKTLLFEYETIDDLAAYMIRNHGAELCTLFGTPAIKNDAAVTIDSPDSPVIDVSAPTVATEPSSLVPPTAREPDQTDDGIAIIGLSGIYPGARSLDEFWQNLKLGKNCVTEIPQNRWSVDEFYDPAPEKADQGKMYCKWGAFLEDVEMFDPLFFNISPKEAELMDPQERLFLETAWRTLEDAGYTSKQIRESIEKKKSADAGVFVGVTSNTYCFQGPNHWRSGSMPIPTSLPWSIANRVSYVFNFHGPSIPVDTACASSLTAIHMACQSIRNDECSIAIAGGVNLYLHPAKYVWMCQMGMLSSKGRCASFGDGADGFVPGEGVGAILLKPFKAAVQDGDNIYAVIKGSAMNHGGSMNEYMVPNPNAQALLISKAIGKAGFDPESISYLEAQGIGSELGDPIEITSLKKAYGEHTKATQYCAIGSLKSNIGHLEAAAGIAGMTKVLLQMKNKQLVPSLHAERLNPNIDFDNSPFFVQRELTSWNKPVVWENEEQREMPRRVGVSSFGAGGINAHVVLEEYEPNGIQDEPLIVSTSRQLIVLSAKNEQRLKVYAKDLSSFLKTNASDPKRHLSIENIAYTLQVGREPMEARIAIIADTPRDLCRQLDNYVDTSSAVTNTNTLFSTLDENSANHIIQDLAKGQFGHDFIELVTTHLDLHKLAMLWVAGIDISWERIHKERHSRRVSLPTYPFERQRCWIHRTSEFADMQEAKRQHTVNIKTYSEEKSELQKVAHNPMRQTLVQWISELLKIPENVLEEDRNLREYGFNSLAGMRLIHRIAERFEVKIPPSKLFEYQTITALSRFLSTMKDVTDRIDPQTVDSASEVIADRRIGENIVSDIDVDRLTDGQVEELIVKLLNPSSEHSAAVSNRPDNTDVSPEQLRA